MCAVANTRDWATGHEGEDTSAPTRAPRPTQYKGPTRVVGRGTTLVGKIGAGGEPLDQTRYGAGQYSGPVSASTPLTARLSDLEANADDDRLAGIAASGLGRKAVPSAVSDLHRTLDGSNAPDGFGMSSARRRQNSTHAASAEKVPGAIDANATDNPARKPA
jgi:hypothetical protein